MLVTVTIEITVWRIRVALFLVCLGHLLGAEASSSSFVDTAFAFLGLLVEADGVHQHAVVDELNLGLGFLIRS